MALFIVLALASGAVVLWGMRHAFANGWQGYAKPLVGDYVDRLMAEIGSPPDADRAAALERRLPITIRIDGPSVQYDSHPWHGRAWDARDADEHELRDIGWGLTRQTEDGHRVRFGLARPPASLRPRLVGWGTLAGLLLLTAIAYRSVRRMLSPLTVIGQGVEAYGRGDFSQTIAVRRNDELGDLARRVNGMAANLSGMLQAQRSLLLAISHELRSPLTRARLNAELVDEGEPRRALLRDLAQMRDLITSLLESERLAQGHGALACEPVDLPALVRDVVAIQFDDADLSLELPASSAPVWVDPMRIRLLLRNLIENALRHGDGMRTPPQVFLRGEDGGRLALGVRDHGPGVSEEQLSKLAQPFHRPDSARSRSDGGVGLGLYLCRLVAEAHGGELRLRRAEPGLEVAMVWSPAEPVAAR